VLSIRKQGRACLLSLWLAVGVAACGFLATPPSPSTPVETVAAVAATVGGLATSVQSQFEAGRITARQAEILYTRLDEALGYVHIAEAAIAAGNPAGAESNTALAQSILLGVEKLLKEMVDE